ncbi:SUMF1/EgtB/PvdO family nonheme iron enzyme [Roseateles oligotrophus]|uniref:SUMF1/EgtB/PvdO family nonheme iron enzyme n=1 Tax=Roseateles oligotrophus TaxID=1769250 RepID=A0ABT2Y8C0_9BURK|nr:SUMF1/EgtB/PvdO family nonheme iron enzyme [Roseateles oligotrophus]MCV2366543.1 SUMF1/EgtB/PvdO family nonheme iron enzyme [Roseateles oligotrophus]
MNTPHILALSLLGLSIQQALAAAPAPAAYIEPPMVTVPSGEFQMGGGKPYMGEAAPDPKALPIHKVKIKAFKLAKYEVTVAEFRRFIEATGYKAPDQCIHQPNQGWFGQGPTQGSWDKNELTTSEFQPAVCIGWAGADAYAKWLSKQTGKSYRLASEAEWEYAASVGKGKPGFPFGEDVDQKRICEYANVSDQSAEHAALERFGATYQGFMGGISPCDDGAGFASIVGMYKPNPLGLYDLIGNASEFLQDCWSENYEGAPADGSARLDGDCKQRVGRGGSWHWRGKTATQRGAMPLDWVGVIEGFRLAQSLDKPADKRSAPTALAFEQELKQAQSVERARRASLQPFPQPPQGLQLTQGGGKAAVQLTWAASPDPKVLGYHVFRSDSVGGDFVRIASDVKTQRYVDEAAPARKHSYVVVAVNRDRFSEFSAPVLTADQVHALPGRIQAEDFNRMDQAFVGKVAPQEDMEDAGGQAGLNLTGGAPGIAKDSWTEYSVELQRAGNYRLSFRVASLTGSKGLALSVNGQQVLEQTVPATGGWKIWQTVAAPGTIRLEAGRHVLRIRAIDLGWKLNWFELELAQ